MNKLQYWLPETLERFYTRINLSRLQNGTTAVKMEIWVDPNDDGNWVNVNNFVDSGGWGKDGGECGGAPDQIISWEGK